MSDPAPTTPHSAPTPTPTPTGLLLIDKQPGFTSMDVCAIIRTRLRRAGAPKRIKVGHGGTLDPMATGLLVILVGKATPLCNQIMVGEKQYTATIDLSQRSTTDDAEGSLTRLDIQTPPTRETLENALPSFRGIIQQRPPQFSAMSVGGRRAYDIARSGQHVELAARPVHIHEFTITGYDWPLLDVSITCGKGTYIRSLARDLGESLGIGGILTALRRTRIGRFHVKDAWTLDQVPDPLVQADLLPVTLLAAAE